MKKIGLLIVVLIMLSACSTNTLKLQPNEYGLLLIEETEHALFFSQTNDEGTKATITQLIKTFEEHYERITTLFNYSATEKTIIHVYLDKQQFQQVIGRQTEGTYDASDNIIKVFTPKFLSESSDEQFYNDQLVHEFVHAIIQQNNPVIGQIKWLDEGTAYYAALQLERDELSEILLTQPPTLEQLSQHDYFDRYGSSAYQYSGLIVKYIIDTYGIELFNEVLLNPMNIESILGQSIEQLHHEWLTQL